MCSIRTQLCCKVHVLNSSPSLLYEACEMTPSVPFEIFHPKWTKEAIDGLESSQILKWGVENTTYLYLGGRRRFEIFQISHPMDRRGEILKFFQVPRQREKGVDSRILNFERGIRKDKKHVKILYTCQKGSMDRYV